MSQSASFSPQSKGERFGNTDLLRRTAYKLSGDLLEASTLSQKGDLTDEKRTELNDLVQWWKSDDMEAELRSIADQVGSYQPVPEDLSQSKHGVEYVHRRYRWSKHQDHIDLANEGFWGGEFRAFCKTIFDCTSIPQDTLTGLKELRTVGLKILASPSSITAPSA